MREHSFGRGSSSGPTQISEQLGLNPKTVEHWLRLMKQEGVIEATEPGRGNKHTKYRILGALPEQLLR